jgi:tetratricopeptide (TPR) repeat protein
MESSLDEARKAYEEVIRIRRQLASATEAVYLPTVAGTLNNLGIVLSQQNDIEGARKAWEEAAQNLPK